MFMGQYNHSIDAKGRVIIPAKFREKLGDLFIITKGLDNCLYGYPYQEWKIFEEKLAALPMNNPDTRKFSHFFFAGAAECELDKQGRVLLPSVLREFAGLDKDKDVVLIGVGNKIEIWNKDKWDTFLKEYDDDMNTVAENMEKLGFTI